jgi:tRNA threonylcarbamoyladenosine biosynthesis protein TsaE
MNTAASPDASCGTTCEFLARDEHDTWRLGTALAAVLPAGTTVALVGTLGAGKTRLVQAVAAACGIPADQVTSPTFVLCQPYEGTRTLFHLDAYRLKDDDEFLGLGPEEYFESEGLTLIEWADRVADCLPSDRVEVRIDVAGESSRRFLVSAIGPRYLPIVTALRQALGKSTELD